MEEADIQEETIVIKGYKEPFTYSLSNSLDAIKEAANQRIGIAIQCLDSVDDKNAWRVNRGLAKKVKAMMNRQDVEYSMTIYAEDIGILKNVKCLALNRRITDTWMFCHGIVFGNEFFASGLGQAEKFLEAVCKNILLEREIPEDSDNNWEKKN